MIDFKNIINYSRTNSELEELMLFTILTANKPSDRTVKVLSKFLGTRKRPFSYVRKCIKTGKLVEKLQKVRTGQYGRITRCFTELLEKYPSGKYLRKADLEGLTSIYGVGMKSASCFLMWTQEGHKMAMLDVHILKFLKSKNVPKVPKDTPTSPKEYKRLQDAFLKFAAKSKKSVAEFDLEIWNHYNSKSNSSNKTTSGNSSLVTNSQNLSALNLSSS